MVFILILFGIELLEKKIVANIKPNHHLCCDESIICLLSLLCNYPIVPKNKIPLHNHTGKKMVCNINMMLAYTYSKREGSTPNAKTILGALINPNAKFS